MNTLVRILIFLATLAFAEYSVACDCAKKLDESSADLVFVGVPEMAAIYETPNRSEYIKYTFRVEKTVKGPALKSLVVETHNSDCGYFFSLGRSYRVVAKRSVEPPREWLVSLCSTTAQDDTPKRK